jgi:hypothetical protein
MLMRLCGGGGAEAAGAMLVRLPVGALPAEAGPLLGVLFVVFVVIRLVIVPTTSSTC